MNREGKNVEFIHVGYMIKTGSFDWPEDGGTFFFIPNFIYKCGRREIENWREICMHSCCRSTMGRRGASVCFGTRHTCFWLSPSFCFPLLRIGR